MQRIDWIDNLKAIAIILVVWGHMSGLNPDFKNIIYSFHIPTFLCITGFLISTHLKTKTFKQIWRYNLKPYLKAYVFFSVVAIFLWYALEKLGANLSVMLAPTKGAFYGVHGKEMLLIHNNDPLWYFPFLIVSLLISYVFLKFNRAVTLILTFIYCLFSFVYNGVRLPWCIDIAGVGVFFIISGVIIREYYDKKNIQEIPSIFYALVISFMLAVILVVLNQINGETNINRATWGNNEFLYLLNAFIGIAMLGVISLILPLTKYFKLLSKQTLLIFCTHIYLVKFARLIPLPENEILEQIIIFIVMLLITTLCLIGAMIVSPLFNKIILNQTYKKD